ncbi:PP2C family serine/threonine-protein phosphatase [Methanoregula sp.]|uniref:PP2C family serine/threonine-protein phosphatase n=1 Tax=Methanoregula sp. TaxID=2052170 RepID=UPI003C726494
MRWKITGSSVTGRSHADRGETGQDCHRAGCIRIGDNEYFIGLVADGAGSTTHGGQGAELACGCMYDRITNALRVDGDISRIADKEIRGFVTASRDAISAEAEATGKRLKDYACTLLGAVSGQGHTLFFQIGDGAIVVSADGGEYDTIFWPEQGEYANTTSFVSDEQFLEHLGICHRDSTPCEIAIFTDGLQTLALSFAQKKAHPGFFRPLFDALRQHPDGGFLDFSGQLSGFLTRDDVSARSDDDKTLVLAVVTQD